jgi:hypothetical protein
MSAPDPTAHEQEDAVTPLDRRTFLRLSGLDLPSGRLRNKKSINLVYVRPGSPSQAA